MHAIHTPPVFGEWTSPPVDESGDDSSLIDLAVSAALGAALLEADVVTIEEGIEALRAGHGPATPEGAALLSRWDEMYGGAAPAESARVIGLANEVETAATEPTKAELLHEWEARYPR